MYRIDIYRKIIAFLDMHHTGTLSHIVIYLCHRRAADCHRVDIKNEMRALAQCAHTFAPIAMWTVKASIHVLCQIWIFLYFGVYRTEPSTCQPLKTIPIHGRFIYYFSYSLTHTHPERVNKRKLNEYQFEFSSLTFHFVLFSLWMPLGIKPKVSRVFCNKINPSHRTDSVALCSVAK